MYGWVLLFHVLGATIWTGGHIVLSVVILPKVLREKSPEKLIEFESVYEKIGMPALIIQILSGLYLAKAMIPDVSAWFDLDQSVSRVVLIKLALLMLTFAFALDAKLRVIPKLNEDNLTDMAFHIIPVTVLSILFVITGVSFRTGWFY